MDSDDKLVRSNEEMARTLAHELTHYVLNDGDHDNRSYNLLGADADGTNRDLDGAQVKSIANSVVKPSDTDANFSF